MGQISLQSLVLDLPDFPKAGVLFRDITPLLANPAALRQAILEMSAPWRDKGIDLVAGAEARGFLFGTAMAIELGCGFVPVRKPKKLPRAVFSEAYQLEYGVDHLELHKDAAKAGQKVLLVDDVLATGGTMNAAEKLVRSTGAEVVGFSFLIELAFLGGRPRLGAPVHSLIQY